MQSKIKTSTARLSKNISAGMEVFFAKISTR